MDGPEERAVGMVGGVIAAMSAAVLVVSLFTAWGWQACIPGICAPSRGWALLGLGRPVLLGSAVAGLAVLAAQLLGTTARRWVGLVAGGVALGGALYVVHRASVLLTPRVVPLTAAVVPGAVGLRAGPFIALVACFGVAGGGWLAAIGTRVFDRAPWAPAGVAGVAGGAVVIIVALWLPWVRPGFAPEAAAPAQLAGLSGWQAAPTLSLLLALGAMAILGGALIAAIVRWRAVFLALALAGWLEAAFALAVAPHLGGGLGTRLLAGVYVAAAGAALIGAGGAAAAIR